MTSMKRLLLLAPVMVMTATQAVSADPIKFKARGVIVATTSHSAKVQSLETDHQAFLNVYDGAVVPDAPEGFLANARYQIVEMIDTSGTINGGYKTFTAADGTVFGRYEVTGADHPNYHGTFTLTGGSGKYASISGSGKFSALAVSENALIDMLEGTYELPKTR